MAAAALAAAGLIIAGPSLSAAQSGSPAWATFQGNMGRSGVANVTGTTVNSEANAFGGIPIGAMEGSAAISATDTAYVGDDDGYVYAFSPSSPAAALWKFKADGPVIGTPSLTSDNSKLFVGSMNGTVYAINASTGAKIWSQTLGGSVAASPVIGSDGTIYVPNTNGTVFALAGTDGKVIWQQAITGAIDGSLALSPDGHTLYAAGTAGYMYGINTADGKLGTAFYLTSSALGSPSVDANGNIYVTTSTGDLMSFSPGSGTARWIFPTNAHAASHSTPAVSNSLA
ncbi:MAG: PQQ-binding-like beta-propeller repeat protein, partial [Chloroflexota bacterium]